MDVPIRMARSSDRLAGRPSPLGIANVFTTSEYVCPSRDKALKDILAPLHIPLLNIFNYRHYVPIDYLTYKRYGAMPLLLAWYPAN
jgi:hypothetical protein